MPKSDIWENIGVLMKIKTHNFHCDLPFSVNIMGESFQDYSLIQGFCLKMLNSTDSYSFFEVFSANLKTINHLNLK